MVGNPVRTRRRGVTHHGRSIRLPSANVKQLEEEPRGARVGLLNRTAA
jgi:hypothetical protein